MSSRSPVGAACPYCHFPIKSGVEVTSCDACGSPHHVECWAENEGCAVTGCSRYAGPAGAGPATPTPPQGPAAYDTAETAALPQGPQAPLRPRTPTPPAYAPQGGQPRSPQYAPQSQPSQGWGAAPPPSSGPSGGDGSRGKWIALGAVIPLVVILAVVVGYVLASPGKDKKDDGNRNAAQVTTTSGKGDGKGATTGKTTGTTTGPAPASTTGTPSTGGGSGGGAPPPAGQTQADQQTAKKKQVAQQLLTIMGQSGRGRDMTRSGDYGDALTNRDAVLRKLAALQPADAAQRSAINTFRSAISASRSSIQFHSTYGPNASTGYDTTATSQKRLYCQKWASSGMGALTGQSCDPEGI